MRILTDKFEMKMKKYTCLFLLLIGLVLPLCIQSCSTSETDVFGKERLLYFERQVKRPTDLSYEWVRVDTAVISVTHYPGEEKIEHPFRVVLIGDTLQEDAEYRVIVVDTLTNAREGMVTYPEKLYFRKGMVMDSLWMTIHTGEVEKDKEFYITLRLIANENFGIGYRGYSDVRLRFNNKASQPEWWDNRVEEVYLGAWSEKKFETFVLATGLTSFEGMAAGEMRFYSLKVKEYVGANNVTEDDGTPMMIPIY